MGREAYAFYSNSSLLSHFSGVSCRVPILSNDLHQENDDSDGDDPVEGVCGHQILPSSSCHYNAVVFRYKGVGIAPYVKA